MFQWLRKIYDRVTSPDQDRSRSQGWIPRSNAGVNVNYDTAMTYAAVWCSVRVISEALSQLPWRAMRKTSRGNIVDVNSRADNILAFAPNPEMTPSVWREITMRHVLTWGNAYSEITRDGAARTVAMWPIDPSRVEVRRLEGFGIAYIVRPMDGFSEERIIQAKDMFHLRGLGDELLGWSPIRYGVHTIGLGLAGEQSMSSLIKNDSRPAGILTPVGNLSKQAADQIIAEWEATHGGAKNKGRTALLSHEMNYKPLSLPNSDVQLLESRRFNVLDICRFFRVPPHKVMDLERATFSNIEHQGIEFVQDTLIPWAVKMEQEANRKIVSPRNRGTLFTKINMNAMLRGDFASRARGYQMLFDRGVYSVNDILELEDRNTIGADGDKRFVPLNFTTLDKAGEDPPEPEPVALPISEDDSKDESIDDEQAKDREQLRVMYEPILRDCIERIITREIKAIEKPLAAGNTDKIKLFYSGHESYIVSVLRPHEEAIKAVSSYLVDVAGVAGRITQLHRSEALSGRDMNAIASSWRQQIDDIISDILEG